MGLNTRFGKVADATYSVPSTSAAAIAVTFSTHEPTATTALTVADGSSPTVVESGQFIANVEAQLVNVVADIAALKAAIAQLAVDNAAMLTKINEGE